MKNYTFISFYIMCLQVCMEECTRSFANHFDFENNMCVSLLQTVWGAT